MTELIAPRWSIDVGQIPGDELQVTFTVEPDERAALATAYGLVEVKALTASADIRRDGSGHVTVDGRVVADIVQTCVVSLVPVDQHIDEPISVNFVAADSPERPAPPKPGVDVVIRADEPDPPEVLTDHTIDLGAVVEEHFALAIDPYPRAPSAALPAEVAEPPQTETDSPFADLAKLVKGRPHGH